MSKRTAYTPWTLWMPFLPGRIYGGRPILDIHSRQSDQVARVDIEMDSSAVVPWVFIATWSDAPSRLQSRWQISQKCLRLPLLLCLLPPNQVGPLLLDPGQLQISRLTPLQKWNAHKSNVKSIKKDNIILIALILCGRHFFSYVHMVGCTARTSAFESGPFQRPCNLLFSGCPLWVWPYLWWQLGTCKYRYTVTDMHCVE